MGAKQAALLLAPEPPFPLTGGGALRTASIFTYLQSRYTVDAILFRQPGAPDPVAAFPSDSLRRALVLDLPFHRNDHLSKAIRNGVRLLKGVPPLVDRFAGFERQIQEFAAGKQYDVGVIEHFWAAGYSGVLAPHCRRLILDLHNIESVLHARCSRTEGWIQGAALQRFARVCADLERRSFANFDCLLLPSVEDDRLARELCPQARTVLYPNSIPYSPQPAVPKREEIVFSGNLAYHPNISAVAWFAREVWPSLRESWPALRWRILGRGESAIRHLVANDPRIAVEGPVLDAVQSLAESRVSIAPILAGSGTRIKIIEAWAAGLPVVSTRIGSEGLPGEPGRHLLLADTPEEFAAAVSQVLASDVLQRELGQNGRLLYERELTWEAAWKRLSNEL